MAFTILVGFFEPIPENILVSLLKNNKNTNIITVSSKKDMIDTVKNTSIHTFILCSNSACNYKFFYNVIKQHKDSQFIPIYIFSHQPTDLCSYPPFFKSHNYCLTFRNFKQLLILLKSNLALYNTIFSESLKKYSLMTTDKKHLTILERDILFVESYDRKVLFHLKNNKSFYIDLKFKEALKILDKECFFQIHRSFIINLNSLFYIKPLDYSWVAYFPNSSKTALISRSYYKKLNALFS